MTAWSRNAWMLLSGLTVLGFILGFTVAGRFDPDAAPLGTWAAFCRTLGFGADLGAATEVQPQTRTPTTVAWTRETLTKIASGDAARGAFIALNCTACHGEEGVSGTDLAPTLAGADAAVIYKELADYRSGKRAWGVMNGVAKALTERDFADVAVYFASRPHGLPPITGILAPRAGRSLRQSDPASRLVYSGDPSRGIAPCAVCHGPSGYKIGAPALMSQRTAYIERQTAAFAQGERHNDIDEQMRTVAAELTAQEIHAVAVFYGASGVPGTVP